MKSAFTLFLSLLLVSGAFAQEKPLPAKKILDEAYAQASKENKKVMVIFHASWCGWCHRMDSIMNQADMKPLFDKNFVIRHLVVMESKGKENLENPGALEFMYKNNGQNQGIPFFLILDTKGKLLGDSRMPSKDKAGKEVKANVGCPAQPEEVDYFIGLLKKTTSLNDTDLALISERFLMKKAAPVTH